MLAWLSNQQRLEAYRMALSEASRSPKTDWVVMSDEEYGRTNDVAIGQQLLSKLFNTGVTGIFCYNDMVAVNALLGCQERGISVPQDLSLVGFDGIALSRYVTPPLTTVYQPMLELGRSAMQMLLDVLQEKSVENQVLSPFLVKRGSSAGTVSSNQ
ncbi:LacI family DNA-binding transcriptional regulator [Scytonema sp. NUACC26]|uniref:LacI family DNA-binding transcriptional regulator n=1 Tax=Scytonema sp. NUACC26 TaxID=3140176 RepID=UPI0034DCBCE0